MNLEPRRMSGTKDMMVVVDKAYKRYTPLSVVLRGLNMNVPTGTIYGLLGPSGCGKTTLLSCIVGRSSLDSGSITVNVKSKRSIGYMPQELALYTEFSIRETTLYYGRIFGLSFDQIYSRTKELISFLDLPPEDSIVGKLSGGQSRRLSLLVALLHDPKLLILDEPTVGVDPVLSASIWQHLLNICNNGKKTVIITTHYIEEARQAHCIGLMRGGTLLAEESPSQLMLRYNCNNLEQAFLELSKKQSIASGTQDDSLDMVETYPSVEDKKNVVTPLQSNKMISKSRITAQLVKNYYWMKRNKPIMCFLLLLPLVQCFLFCTCVGRDPRGLKLAVVNHEFEGGLKRCNQYPMSGCNLSFPLSCRYVENIRKKTIVISEFPDIESAKEAVRHNRVWGLIYFAQNYTESLIERISERDKASKMAMELSDVQVYQDMSNQYIGNMMRRDLLVGYVDFLQDLFSDCGWSPKSADIPITMEPAIYGNNNPSFVHFTAPAIISLFEFYLPMIFTVGAILMEKMAGLLERSLVAGITIPEVILSHIVVQLVILAVQTAIMIFVLFVLFDNPLIGSIPWALTLLLTIGLAGMCYGFMVAIMCDTDTAATFMGLGTFFPLAMLSGMIWPLEGMHWILRSVGWALPLTLPTEAFRGISARDWPITHPTVYKGFFSSLGWMGFFLLMTFVAVQFKKGLRVKSK
uniref:ABC transporter G family member 20 n=1 Tax=Cacopsylla melanoneura TaxID=428564 RepID=A0A8D9E369_9HEMI